MRRRLTEPNSRSVFMTCSGIRQKLQIHEASSLISYHFQASIKVEDSEIIPILHDVNERKRELLLQRIHTYITNKLENKPYPTDPRESFFLAKHLVDPLLFPNGL